MGDSNKLNLIVNGGKHASKAGNLHSLLRELGLNTANIVAEVNGSIVPGKDFGQTCLADGDVIELINFVGGG